MSANIYYIDDVNFDKVTMQGKMPVLIDFYADWCGPCRTLSTIIEKVADLYDGKVLFCKMNVDENPNTPNRYKIAAIPTVILFIDGLAAEKAVGLHDVDFYRELLDKHLRAPEEISEEIVEDGDVDGDTVTDSNE